MIEIEAYTDALVSHAMITGWFDQVNEHEPKSSINAGMTAAVWFTRLKPAPAASGLASTAGVLEMRLRIYISMTTEPADTIDPSVVKATSDLLTRYSADFTLDGMIRNVDLLGEFGQALEARSGYLDVGGTKMRVVDLFIPLVINDLFGQEA